MPQMGHVLHPFSLQKDHEELQITGMQTCILLPRNRIPDQFKVHQITVQKLIWTEKPLSQKPTCQDSESGVF